MSIEKTINELLVELFHEIIGIEEKTIRKNKKFSKMTTNDMHVIEAIGPDEPKTMSTVAKTLNVTLGTLTISVNSLVKKGYVNRVRSEKDRRVVLVSLTKEGMQAYRHHQKFHDEMIQSVIETLEDDEREVLHRALDKLNQFFKEQ